MTREEILRSMECVLESDKRTIKNPISEYGWLFDKIYKWKKSLEQEPKTGYCEDIDRNKLLKAINLLRSADIDEETGDVQWHTWYKGIGKDVEESLDIAIRYMQALDQEPILDKIKKKE